MKIFLNKEILTSEASNEAITTYIALRMLMDDSMTIRSQERTVTYISSGQLSYSLLGIIDNSSKKIIMSGLNDLHQSGLIEILDKQHSEYIVDLCKLYLDTSTEYFIIVEDWEIKKIMNSDEISQLKKRVSLVRYFTTLISTFNNSRDFYYGKGKIGHMSIEYIAGQAHISPKTAQRYNVLLENLKIIYVYRTSDKLLANGKTQQIKNCYSRYADQEICIAFGQRLEAMGIAQRNDKEASDHNRSLAQKYNHLCNVYIEDKPIPYSEEEIKEILTYINAKNVIIDHCIQEVEQNAEPDQEYINALRSKKRDVSFLHEILEIEKKDETTIYDMDNFLKEILEPQSYTKMPEIYTQTAKLDPDEEYDERLPREIDN